MRARFFAMFEYSPISLSPLRFSAGAFPALA
jgi:hypothetical protein